MSTKNITNDEFSKITRDYEIVNVRVKDDSTPLDTLSGRTRSMLVTRTVVVDFTDKGWNKMLTLLLEKEDHDSAMNQHPAVKEAYEKYLVLRNLTK